MIFQNKAEYIAWELAVASFGENKLVEEKWQNYLALARDIVEVLENPDVTWPMEVD